LRRIYLHESGGDGIKIQGSHFTMEDCWIRHLGSADGAHADGVQGTVNGVGTRWKNHAYRRNFFDMAVNELTGSYKSNFTIFLHRKAEGAGIDGIILDGNYLIGGNNSVGIDAGMTG